MAYRVVVSDNRRGDYSIEAEVLKGVAEVVVLDCTNVQEMIDGCKDADGVLLDQAKMPREVVEQLKHCKVVSRYGVGYDNVDVAACTEHGIQVAYVPDFCYDDVSDMAMGLILDCARQITWRDRQVHAGKWNLPTPTSFRLRGKTLSLLGFGRIAKALAKKAKGFDLEILVYDPYLTAEQVSAEGCTKVSLDEALQQADILSLHMPVTEETRGIINRENLARMKPTAVLVNTGRGALVDDAALIEALSTGKLAAAGLDTHNTEPLCADSPYRSLENCVLTDHAAYYTKEALVELATKAARNVRDVLEGRKPEYPLNFC